MPPRDYYLPGRRLISQEDAATIESANVPRSKFVGSWSRKTTFDAGYLVPFMVEEVLPGDHLSYEVTAYVRMATPLFPIFDNQRIDTFFFFVPNRICWGNWVAFMGEQADPLGPDPDDFTIPIITFADDYSHDTGTIFDHMGVAAAVLMSEAQTINALPFRAYIRIYNDWFRDQNLIAKTTPHTGNGPDPSTDYTLKKRAKAHDYFTSALPWPQKFTAPTIPMGGNAPIIGIGIPDDLVAAANSPQVYETDKATTRSFPFYRFGNTSTGADAWFMEASDPALGDVVPKIYADLAAATGIAINTFRQAFLVNQLLERDARGGTRYVELIRSHFGVVNPDFRVQRPEYIGGGQTPLIITPVAQTAPTDDTTVGALGAAATAAGNHRASYAATEHGYIIALINVRSELSYQLGSSLHRMWTRRTRYDFYWPSLAQLGEQAILRKEIFWRPDLAAAASDNLVFGYQERWHEYRTRYSEVTGSFRSVATDSLDTWHLAQWFDHTGAAPVLNQAFIEDTPPMTRILAAAELAEKQQYLADILIHRTAVRPLPTFGTPATLGRF